MAVKILKIIFGKVLTTLTNHKPFFVNYTSDSLITGRLSFLIQLKLVGLALLSSNCWSFDFNATIFQKKNFGLDILDIFVLLVLFEI